MLIIIEFKDLIYCNNYAIIISEMYFLFEVFR